MRIRGGGIHKKLNTALAVYVTSDVPTVPCHAHFQAITVGVTSKYQLFFVSLPPKPLEAERMQKHVKSVQNKPKEEN